MFVAVLKLNVLPPLTAHPPLTVLEVDTVEVWLPIITVPPPVIPIRVPAFT